MIDTAEQQRRFPNGVGDWAVGYMALKPMEDGRFLVLMTLALNRARVSIAEDEWSLGEGWCFDEVLLAFASFIRYPEPPVGWTRHMLGDGRNEYPGEAP